MWKIIHLNSGHTLVTEDNIDLTKPLTSSPRLKSGDSCRM